MIIYVIIVTTGPSSLLFSVVEISVEMIVEIIVDILSDISVEITCYSFVDIRPLIFAHALFHATQNPSTDHSNERDINNLQLNALP